MCFSGTFDIIFHLHRSPRFYLKAIRRKSKEKGLQLAGILRKGLFSFVAFEVTCAAIGFAAFRTVRRSEEKRKYLYLNWPTLASTYYWCEDSISFGQLTGTRLRLSDQRRWAQIDPSSENIETD